MKDASIRIYVNSVHACTLYFPANDDLHQLCQDAIALFYDMLEPCEWIVPVGAVVTACIE